MQVESVRNSYEYIVQPSRGIWLAKMPGY